MTPEAIYDLFFDSHLTGLFEEGKIPPEEFFKEVKNKLGLDLDYEGFLPIWNEIFFLTEENRGVYNLAKHLKADFKIALLSNINILHYDYLRKNFPVFDVFDHIITSYEVGVRT
jgi:FMN phosphatase YigB (HAD superfamily)